MIKPELNPNPLIPNPEVFYAALIFLGFGFLISKKEGKKGERGLNYHQDLTLIP